MNFSDLERLIDRELSGLPAPEAPGTLLPRVLRAADAQQRDSFGAWFTWPLLWQASSLALMGLLFAGAMNLRPLAAWALAALLSGAAGEPGWVAGLVRQVSDIAGAAAVLWRVLEPVAIVLVLFLATMFAASAALGAALRSVVLGGTSRP